MNVTECEGHRRHWPQKGKKKIPAKTLAPENPRDEAKAKRPSVDPIAANGLAAGPYSTSKLQNDKLRTRTGLKNQPIGI